MPHARPRPHARLGAAVQLLLLLAAVAILGLVVPWCVEDTVGKSGIAWRQPLAAIAVSIVALSVLLYWITRTRGPIHAFCLVFGVLSGLCVVVDAAIGLAVFDYSISRDMAVALRIVRVVPGPAAAAAIAGSLLGFFAGTAVSFIRRRTEITSTTDATGNHTASSGRRWLTRAVGLALLVGVAVALYSPVAHELRRRHAILSLRASGAKVEIVERPFAQEMPWREQVVDWLQAGGFDWQREGALYSLESVQAIDLGPRASDAQLGWASRLPEVPSIDLRGAQLTDEGWQQLALLSNLAILNAQESNITDEGLQALTGAALLRDLYLGGTEVSDQGLSHLAGLSLLVNLDLSDTRITDDGLRHLCGMVGLRSVFLRDTTVNGAGLKHLAAIQGLGQLDLSRTELSETGLGALSAQPQLGMLSFEGARFSEATFRELAQFSQVVMIQLHDTNVVDAWLPHLSGMKNRLLRLTLGGTPVTAEGLRALRQALPRTNVTAGSKPYDRAYRLEKPIEPSLKRP